jgi:DNA-binding FrmR family transcriptional regulator
MADMKVTSPVVKQDLQKRLRRIEGQVRGVQKMIADERECTDILQQLAAVRSAVHQTTLALVRSYASECLLKPDAESTPEEIVDSLIGVLNKVP